MNELPKQSEARSISDIMAKQSEHRRNMALARNRDMSAIAPTQYSGEKHHLAKYATWQVTGARAMLAANKRVPKGKRMTWKSIGMMFGIPYGTVRKLNLKRDAVTNKLYRPDGIPELTYVNACVEELDRAYAAKNAQKSERRRSNAKLRTVFDDKAANPLAQSKADSDKADVAWMLELFRTNNIVVPTTLSPLSDAIGKIAALPASAGIDLTRLSQAYEHYRKVLDATTTKR